MSKQSNLVNSSQDITVDASGNVGIGTGSPNAQLEVSSAVDYSGLKVSGTNHKLIAIETSTSNRQVITSYKSGSHEYTIGLQGDDSFNFYDNTNTATRMAIGSSGCVTMPYQPSFRASFSSINYNQSGQIIPVFNYTEHNRGNHYNTSTGVFTAPVAGSYLFSMGMAAEAASTAGFFVIELMVNGAIDYTKFSTSAVNTGISEGGVSGSVVCSLQANDAVKVLWYTPVTISVGRATGGANVWWNGRNYFSGCFLG